MKYNNYFHSWFMPMNGLRYETPYAGSHVKFMTLYNSLNRDILHSLRFHCNLSRFVLVGEVTDKEESNMHFSFSTSK